MVAHRRVVAGKIHQLRTGSVEPPALGTRNSSGNGGEGPDTAVATIGGGGLAMSIESRLFAARREISSLRTSLAVSTRGEYLVYIL